MSITIILYLLASIFSSATLGIYLDRRLNRRPVKMLPLPSIDRLLSGISSDDQQWLGVFRETVMASDGQVSPFLESWLNPNLSITAITKSQDIIKNTDIVVKDKLQAQQETVDKMIADAVKQSQQILSTANSRALADSNDLINKANLRAAQITELAESTIRNRKTGEAEYMVIIKEANRKRDVILNAAKNKAHAIELQAQARTNALALMSKISIDQCEFPNCKEPRRENKQCINDLCWKHCKMSCVCGD